MLSLEKANIGILTKVAIFIQELSWKTLDTKLIKLSC